MIILAGCVTSAKYSMTAKVLPQGVHIPDDPDEPAGHWEYIRDPVTGDVERVWVEDSHPDDPNTPDDESMLGARIISCQANSIISGGINSQGVSERWTPQGVYENIDYVEMRVSPNVVLRQRDRITDITGPNGNVIWVEEDRPPVDGVYPSTVFQVTGVAPSLDFANQPIENFVLLKRAENQELNPGGTDG